MSARPVAGIRVSVWHASLCRLFPPFNHQSQIINHQSRGSASDQSVPLPWGGVARIVPEFCARVTPQNRVTPCARRNKRFFAHGVFYLVNCCTNGVVRRVGCARHAAARRARRRPARPAAATRMRFPLCGYQQDQGDCPARLLWMVRFTPCVDMPAGSLPGAKRKTLGQNLREKTRFRQAVVPRTQGMGDG
jgi:hypothetical protein